METAIIILSVVITFLVLTIVGGYKINCNLELRIKDLENELKSKS